MCPTPQTASKAPSAKELPLCTLDDVAKHNKEDDAWIILDGLVYDVTKFIPDHPGGEIILKGLAGMDATIPFTQFHPVHIWKSEPSRFLVGKLEKDSKKILKSDMVDDFRNIQSQMRAEGLYDTNYYWYVGLMTWIFSILGACIYFVRKGSSENDLLQVLLGGGLLGLFWQQLAFVGHDLGHNSVTHVRNNDWSLGMPVVVFFGISVQWWKRSHNNHHVFSNSIDWDQDIQHLPFIALDKRIMKGFHSFYYDFRFNFGRIERFLVSWQHVIFYPVMMVARFNMYFQSYLLAFLMRHDAFVGWWFEVGALGLHWVYYLWILSHIPRWDWILYAVIMAHAVVALIHIQITLSHFAMPFYEGTGYKKGDKEAWIVKQFETTMDVDCSTWLDWFHGGLQFQLVHHLYPRIPRHNLRYVRDKYILPFAKKHGLTYHLHTFPHAIFSILLPRLRNEAYNASKIEFKNSMLGDMFNMNG